MTTMTTRTGTAVGRIATAVIALALGVVFTVLPSVLADGTSPWTSLAWDFSGGALAGCAFIVTAVNVAFAVKIIRRHRTARRQPAPTQESIEFVATRSVG